MTHKCELCNYTSTDKSNFNKHMKSVSHTKKLASVSVPEKRIYTCVCEQTFVHASSFSRHKAKSCPKNQPIAETKELKEEITVLKSNLKHNTDVITKLLELVSTGQLVNTNTNSHNTTHNTYNISVKTYIQQKYPNAPPLKCIDDYSKLTYKDYKLMDTLVYNYNNSNLHKYLGNFIVSYYKKDDPSQQAIWSSDTSRLTYLISELLINNKSVWNHDYKGTKIKECILTPLLEYVRESIDEFFDSIEIKKNKKQDISEIEAEFAYRNSIAKIAEMIDNNILVDNILKYITPYFSIDRDKDKDGDGDNIQVLKITDGLEHFIDKDDKEDMSNTNKKKGNKKLVNISKV